MYKKKKFNIAIVGLGTIGSHLYKYLEKNNSVHINTAILIMIHEKIYEL